MSNELLIALISIIVIQAIVIFFLAFDYILNKLDTFFGGMLSKAFEWIPKTLPWLFKLKPHLTKWWLTYWQKRVVSKEIQKTTGIIIPFDIEFVEAKTVKTQKKGKKLLVMYNPSINPDENFSNIVLAVAENCIPNSKKILNTDLQKCVKLTLAQDIIENHTEKYKSRDFAARHLLKGDLNVLTSNPYYRHLEPIKNKRLFSRLYVHTLSIMGSKFDTSKNQVELRATVERITTKLATVFAGFLDQDVPDLMLPSESDFESGCEFFFRENGLSINLMFIRSHGLFSRSDIQRYAGKVKYLADKGMHVNYVIGGGISLKNISLRDYLKRIEFAKKVTKELKKNDAYELVTESEQPFVYIGKEYPIYIAIFVRK